MSSRNQIDEETTWTIVERLINHTVRLVNEGEQAMVIRKLASSLVAIFKSVNTSWEHALWQLAASLSHGAYVNQHDCQRVDFFGGLLPTLSIPKATALVFFSIALAEEALRLYPEPQDSVRSAIRRALSNVNHALWLVKYILEKITDHSVREAIAPGEIALANEAMGSWKVRNVLSLSDTVMFRAADPRNSRTKMLTHPYSSDLARDFRKLPP